MEEKVQEKEEIKSHEEKKKKEHKKENHASCDEKECHCKHANHEENFVEMDVYKKLEEKNKELENALLKAKADEINYRKRKDEEVSRMMKYCNEDIILELLSTIDNFERAIQMDDENLEDEVSKFLSGIKMIYNSMLQALEKYGVKAIDAFHQPFDPTYHQAVMTEKVDGMDAGMVVEVLQQGYLLFDKVIRHAMVKVSE